MRTAVRPSLSTIDGINTGPGGVLLWGCGVLSNLHGLWPTLEAVRPRRRPEPVGSGGEDRAFADEALSYIDALYGTALRLTRRPQDAEDLVQDTYLKAFRASAQFQRGTNLKAWLFTILHNTFRNMRRHDGRNPGRRQQRDGGAGRRRQRGDEQTPEQLLTRATLDSDLQAALDGLPEAFRQAVWLRDVEEFSYAEIARIVDVPIGTVMSRISRGRRMLYERLAPKRERRRRLRRRGRAGVATRP